MVFYARSRAQLFVGDCTFSKIQRQRLQRLKRERAEYTTVGAVRKMFRSEKGKLRIPNATPVAVKAGV